MTVTEAAAFGFDWLCRGKGTMIRTVFVVAERQADWTISGNAVLLHGGDGRVGHGERGREDIGGCVVVVGWQWAL